MTVPVSSPGVYIEEIPSSVHTVTGVSTSATAFVDFFPRGPVNKATQVDNWNDFQRIFGGIDTRSEASYGVYQFFLNGGQIAWIIRLVDVSAVTAAATAAITVTAPGGGSQPAGGKVDVTWTTNGTVPAGATTLIEISTNGGQKWVKATPWGSPPSSPPGSPSIMLPTTPGVALVRVTVLDAQGNPIASSTSASFPVLPPAATTAIAGVTVSASSPPGQPGGLPITVSWQTPTSTVHETYALLVSTDGGATFVPATTSPAAIPDNATTAQITSLPASAGTPSSVMVQVVARDALGNPAGTGTSSAVSLPSAGPQQPAAPVNSFQLTAANPGVWGNSVVVTLSPGNGVGTFNLTAQAVQNGRILQTESFSNLTSTNPNSGSFVSRVLSTAQLVSAVAPPPASGATGVWLTPPTRTIGLGFSGGSDGNPSISGGQLIANVYGAGGNPLASLDDIAPNVFNLLSMPAVANLDTGAIQSIFANAIQFCESHKAFYLVDIPPATTNVAAMNQFANDAELLNQENIHGAVYYPRLVMPDPVNGYRPRNVGSSGTLAGVYARNDTQVGVWVAPAGTTAVLQGATPAVQTTDSENGQLNPLGINCLRTFPIFGNISWGARTLAGADQIDSEWKYIPVRRLTDFVELSLDQSLKWAVFQPNAEPLWANLRSEIGTFLAGLWAQGALMGQTQDQAFFVRADSTTTTPTDILQGIVNVVIGIAPVKPAEFVILQFQLLAGQSAS